MAKAKKTETTVAQAQFDALISSIRGLERKGATMPYTSLNGHMFAFLDKNGSLALRLPEEDRIAFIRKYKTTLTEAHGSVLKEYVAVPDKMFSKTVDMIPWLRASHDYVKTLKPKPTTRAK